MYTHAYIQIYTMTYAYIYVFMRQSNISEKSRSFFQLHDFDYEKYPKHLIQAV